MKTICVDNFVSRLKLGVVLLVKDARIRLTCELSFYQKSLNLLVLLVPNSVRN